MYDSNETVMELNATNYNSLDCLNSLTVYVVVYNVCLNYRHTIM